MSKARFKMEYTGVTTPCICEEYPNCNCKGHYVYEKNKKRKLFENINKMIKESKESKLITSPSINLIRDRDELI